MASRLELQSLLEEILGSKNVYFQPPESIKMKYDAIVYSRRDIDSRFADDQAYMQKNSYEIIFIYRDPDNIIPMIISRLPLCSFDRHYVVNNLNHDVFTLYY